MVRLCPPWEPWIFFVNLMHTPPLATGGGVTGSSASTVGTNTKYKGIPPIEPSSAFAFIQYLMGADPGLYEGGDVLRCPRDEAVGLVENTVKLLRYLARSRCMTQSDRGGDSVGCLCVTLLWTLLRPLS